MEKTGKTLRLYIDLHAVTWYARHVYSMVKLFSRGSWRNRAPTFPWVYNLLCAGYSRLQHHYCSLVFSHLSQHPLHWTLRADLVFQELKQWFSSAAILDPAHQFIVEVDTSNVTVCTSLSQCSLLGHKLHPCTFFSHHLSPMERYYNKLQQREVDIGVTGWRDGAAIHYVHIVLPEPQKGSKGATRPGLRPEWCTYIHLPGI